VRGTNGSSPPPSIAQNDSEQAMRRTHATISLFVGGWRRDAAMTARATITKTTIAVATIETSDDHNATIAIMAVTRATKEKGQLVNEPREQLGVRRTSHVRRELHELKRRGGSRSYRRVA
jgi:hypothetical protein